MMVFPVGLYKCVHPVIFRVLKGDICSCLMQYVVLQDSFELELSYKCMLYGIDILSYLLEKVEPGNGSKVKDLLSNLVFFSSLNALISRVQIYFLCYLLSKLGYSLW